MEATAAVDVEGPGNLRAILHRHRKHRVQPPAHGLLRITGVRCQIRGQAVRPVRPEAPGDPFAAPEPGCRDVLGRESLLRGHGKGLVVFLKHHQGGGFHSQHPPGALDDRREEPLRLEVLGHLLTDPPEHLQLLGPLPLGFVKLRVLHGRGSLGDQNPCLRHLLFLKASARTRGAELDDADHLFSQEQRYGQQ